MMSNCHDIVVTGLAAISAAGVGLDPLREALASGASRLTPIPEELAGEGHLWGKADGFRAADYMPPLKARKFDRCSLFAVVAAGMALKDAGIDLSLVDRRRIGIVLGCGFGGVVNSEEFLHGWLTDGRELVPMLFPNTVPNASASNASIEHGLMGPNATHVQRFCSAESALCMARRFLEEDRADIVITGGVDVIHPVIIRAFRSMGQLSRFGRSFGEGAGLLVLEKDDHAARRGALVRAMVGEIRTIGLLPPEHAEEGVNRLLGAAEPSRVSLSGPAEEARLLAARFSSVPTFSCGELLGRSLAMGGIAMVSLLLSLAAGERGLHLAASPEGPYYAVDFEGGDPVQS
ncbi:MAG TPA: beta-ketoacyl synthase N-terminal-like domain-containing protein [Geobacteraceae bacterium]|nr:beta-ketoacyl synthase N-terminal-like domain-containing protein [Geobacteraceae bacterium]